MALALALLAAVLHAAVSAMQKGRHDPFTSRASIDFCYGLLTAPAALFMVPFPEPHMWPIFGITIMVHSAYKLLQAMAFSRGDFTLVYPVARGTGPLVTAIAAGFLFGESLSPTQWIGALTLVAGIFGLAAYNISQIGQNRRGLGGAILLAVLTGIAIASYTTVDAYGVRATENPFTFLAWLFFLDAFFMPILALARRGWRPQWRQAIRMLPHGLIGAVVAVLSFGSIIIATRIDNVGQAAVLRESSIVFAAMIGWVFLREPVGPRRLGLIALIAAGAVIVGLGR